MRTAPAIAGLGWGSIARLGLVQTALGAIVVMTTSTINRVMVVEHALPAMVPGFLVALHYVIQLSRPRLGYASDVGGRRTPWIIAGMAVLASGGLLAALATAWIETERLGGVLLAVLAFVLIGLGVGASGTSLLALLAREVAPERRAAAGSMVWMMMIFGFVITAGTAGHFLDPFSGERLVAVMAVVSGSAFVLTLVALAGVERRGAAIATRSPLAVVTPLENTTPVPFAVALREVWGEPKARHFTVFVFVSMLAYSAQDLILEPFAGIVFGMTPGESTRLAGAQNGGVLIGMVLVALCGTLLRGTRFASLKVWTVGGCIASAGALLALGVGGLVGPGWPLVGSVVLLGVANGAFAVAAIGSMMALAGSGRANREGVRMGLWGAAQAIAFAAGGFAGTAAIDLFRALVESPGLAYALVFSAEGLLFLCAARLAAGIEQPEAAPAATATMPDSHVPAGPGWRLTS